MPEFTGFLLNATIISALYAVIAIGFTLIFGVGGVLNFAHGGLITVGAYGAFLVSNKYGYGPWAGLLAGLLVAGVIAAILYAGIIRYVEDRPVTVLILTFVLGFFIQNVLRIFFRNQISTERLVGGSTFILGSEIQNYGILIFVISWVLILGVFGFVNYTKTGKALIATSMSKKGASLVGIESNRINLYTWLLAGAFAGIAGVLLMMRNTGGWRMGTLPMIYAFAIVILGGLGSIKGSVVGAYIIGFTETATVVYGKTAYAGVGALLLLILFLLVKPEGLFGRGAAE